MPLKEITPQNQVGYPELLAELVEELRHPDREGDEANRPYIIEDRPNPLPRFTAIVIWEKWTHLELQHRGAMIMEAYREARGEAELQKVGVAMGLTRDEVFKLGLDRRYGLSE